MKNDSVSVLILNYNNACDCLRLCNRLSKYNIIEKILVVDNYSTDNSYYLLKTKSENIKKIEIVESGFNGGYGYGNNFGLELLAKKNVKYVLLCNPDIDIEEETIEKLFNFLEKNNSYLIAAPFMLNIDGTKNYNTAYRIPSKFEYLMSMSILLGRVYNRSKYKKNEFLGEFIDVDVVAGSLFMININLLDNRKLFDESIFLFCEETVVAIKTKQLGYKIALLANDYYIHKHSVSIKKTYSSSKKIRQLLLQSRLYLLKEYYNANNFELIVARILSKLSYYELEIKEFILNKLDR